MISALDRFPERGAVPRDERLRSLDFRFLVSDPYLVFYKVLRTQIRIYRILHGMRRYRGLL